VHNDSSQNQPDGFSQGLQFFGGYMKGVGQSVASMAYGAAGLVRTTANASAAGYLGMYGATGLPGSGAANQMAGQLMQNGPNQLPGQVQAVAGAVAGAAQTVANAGAGALLSAVGAVTHSDVANQAAQNLFSQGPIQAAGAVQNKINDVVGAWNNGNYSESGRIAGQAVTDTALTADGAVGLAKGGLSLLSKGAKLLRPAAETAAETANLADVAESSAEGSSPVKEGAVPTTTEEPVEPVEPEAQNGAATETAQGPTGCFVAGTPTWINQRQLVAVNQDSEDYKSTPNLPFESNIGIVPIENIALGQRVPSRNPVGFAGDLPDLDYNEWKVIRLEVEHQNGSIVDVEWLRSEDWIERNGLRVGAEIDLRFTEIAVHASGRVVSIVDGPEVVAGDGAVVIGRFVTRQGSNLVRLTLEDGTELVGTANHPIWSPVDWDWRGMGKFKQGEYVQTRLGLMAVASIEALPGRQPVYNIEVHGESVYEVTELGILVHNNNDLLCKRLQELTAKADKTPAELAEMAELRAQLGSNGLPTPLDLVRGAKGQEPPPVDINFEHIINGEVRTKTDASGNLVQRAVGGHYTRSGNVRITEVVEPVDRKGVMVAKVEIRNPATGGWVAKRANSSMFPAEWSQRQLQMEVEGALRNSKPSGGDLWEGVSPSGLRIQGYYSKPNGGAVTAWPVHGG
jgi:hypothetical protein